MTGTYTLLVDPTGAATGSLTFTLYDVPPDSTGTITVGGPAVPATITTPGQNATLTFSGTAGQRISLALSASTLINLTGGCANAGTGATRLLQPNGTTLATTTLCSGGFLDTLTLPVTGTYTLLVDPTGAATGSLTFTLYDVPPDVTGTLTIGGPAVPAVIATPGQNAALTFSGTAGQKATVHVTSNTMSCVTVSLVKPDSTSLTSSTSCSGSFTLTAQTLPTTGTYTIRIDPSDDNTGSMQVNVTSP